jgi:antitoxin (DNA-binding transcriptional repressor) of toxin-antitoxin stability system
LELKPLREDRSMVTVNVHEVGRDLEGLVQKMLAGEEVVFAQAGKPVARLIPYASSVARRRTPGRYAGQIFIPDDFHVTPDDWIDDLEGRGR